VQDGGIGQQTTKSAFCGDLQVGLGLVCCSRHCTASTCSGRVHSLPWGVVTRSSQMTLGWLVIYDIEVRCFHVLYMPLLIV